MAGVCGGVFVFDLYSHLPLHLYLHLYLYVYEKPSKKVFGESLARAGDPGAGRSGSLGAVGPVARVGTQYIGSGCRDTGEGGS